MFGQQYVISEMGCATNEMGCVISGKGCVVSGMRLDNRSV